MKRPKVIFAGSAASPEQFPRDGLPEVAFLGRSNVGKSSLLNAVVGVQNLARVSRTPGRTRLVNFFRVGSDFYLADLPGYGYARVPEAMRRAWEHLVTSYLGRRPIALGVFLVDARHPPTEGDELLRSYLNSTGFPYILAATKADALTRGEVVHRLESLRGSVGRGAREVLAVSARTGLGIDTLWRAIRDATARQA